MSKNVAVVAVVLASAVSVVSLVSCGDSTQRTQVLDESKVEALELDAKGSVFANDYSFYRILLKDGTPCVLMKSSTGMRGGLSCDWNWKSRETRPEFAGEKQK